MESKWKKISLILIIALITATAVLAGFYRFELQQGREIEALYDLKIEQLAQKETELQQTQKMLRMTETLAQAARADAEDKRKMQADCEDLRKRLSKK